MIHIQEYTNGKGKRRLLLSGSRDALLDLGVEEAELSEPHPKTGNVRVRIDDPDIEEWKEAANVQNAFHLQAEQEKLRKMTMKDFIENEDALLFYTAVSKMKVGEKVTHSTLGSRLLGVRWSDLAGVMMRDGWVEVTTMKLTVLGLEEAEECRMWMTERGIGG